MTSSLAEDEIRVHLISLSSLKADCKFAIDTHDSFSVQPPSAIQGVVRFIQGEGRAKTVEFLKRVVQISIDYTHCHTEFLLLCEEMILKKRETLSSELLIKCSEKYSRLYLLTNSMRDSLRGFTALEKTYKESVSSQIKVLHEKVTIQIKQNLKVLNRFQTHFGSKIHLMEDEKRTQRSSALMIGRDNGSGKNEEKEEDGGQQQQQQHKSGNGDGDDENDDDNDGEIQ